LKIIANQWQQINFVLFRFMSLQAKLFLFLFIY
jgi:hypothetical protein